MGRVVPLYAGSMCRVNEEPQRIRVDRQHEGERPQLPLTGRHGFFSTYEAFVHVVDSMFNQHAKWLDIAHDIPWRTPKSTS